MDPINTKTAPSLHAIQEKLSNLMAEFANLDQAAAERTEEALQERIAVNKKSIAWQYGEAGVTAIITALTAGSGAATSQHFMAQLIRGVATNSEALQKVSATGFGLARAPLANQAEVVQARLGQSQKTETSLEQQTGKVLEAMQRTIGQNRLSG